MQIGGQAERQRGCLRACATVSWAWAYVRALAEYSVQN
jgi:hypothetical protein